MEARLLYIRENEMNSGLKHILNVAERSSIKFFVLVEIKPIQEDSMPMINGLKEIRLNKVEDKIEEWFKKSLPKNLNFELSVFEGKPNKDRPPLSLKDIKRLHVFVDAANDIRIVPFLRAHLKPKEIVFYPIEQLKKKEALL